MAIPTLDQKMQELQDIRKVQSQAQDRYQQYVGQAPEIPSLVQAAIKKRTNNNQQLVQREADLNAQLKTTPTDYAAELQGGRFAGNPILAGQAAAQREANIQKNLDVIKGIRQEQAGTISDITQGVTGAYQAESDRAKAALDASTAQYNQASNEYDQLAKGQQLEHIDLGNKIGFFDQNGNLIKSVPKGKLPSSGGGGSDTTLRTSTGKVLTQSQVDTYVNKALAILKDPTLSDNPTEASGKTSDQYLSENEQKRAIDKIQSVYGLDPQTAHEIFARAYQLGNFQDWTGSPDQLAAAGF